MNDSEIGEAGARAGMHLVPGGGPGEPSERRYQRHIRWTWRERRWRERRSLRCPRAGAAGAGWQPQRRRSPRGSGRAPSEVIAPAIVWRGPWAARGEPRPSRRRFRKRTLGSHWRKWRDVREMAVQSKRLFSDPKRADELEELVRRVGEGLGVLREIASRYLGPIHPDGGGGLNEPPRAMWEEIGEQLPHYLPAELLGEALDDDSDDWPPEPPPSIPAA